MAKGDQSLETPPSYVESVGPPVRPNSQQQYPSQSGGGAGQPTPPSTSLWQQPQQQQQGSSSVPLSPAQTTASSDSGSTHGSTSFWGRKKGGASSKSSVKGQHRHQEKEDTSAERQEFMERRKRHTREQTEEGSSLANDIKTYVARIPPSAQKALAPLRVSTDSKPILAAYSVELSDSIAYAQAANGTTAVSPTCSFTSTARNDIDVTLYFRPPPTTSATNSSGPPLPPRSNPRSDIPLEILANNKKGKIKLTIPHRMPGRPLRIICSLESNAYLYLPPEFDGKLAVWAPQGTVELSETLRRNSTIIPSTSNNAYITVWKITPTTPEQQITSRGPSNASQLPPNVMDLAQVNTTKGRVRVEYAKSSDDGCVIM